MFDLQDFIASCEQFARARDGGGRTNEYTIPQFQRAIDDFVATGGAPVAMGAVRALGVRRPSRTNP